MDDLNINIASHARGPAVAEPGRWQLYARPPVACHNKPEKTERKTKMKTQYFGQVHPTSIPTLVSLILAFFASLASAQVTLIDFETIPGVHARPVIHNP